MERGGGEVGGRGGFGWGKPRKALLKRRDNMNLVLQKLSLFVRPCRRLGHVHVSMDMDMYVHTLLAVVSWIKGMHLHEQKKKKFTEQEQSRSRSRSRMRSRNRRLRRRRRRRRRRKPPVPYLPLDWRDRGRSWPHYSCKDLPPGPGPPHPPPPHHCPPLPSRPGQSCQRLPPS